MTFFNQLYKLNNNYMPMLGGLLFEIWSNCDFYFFFCRKMVFMCRLIKSQNIYGASATEALPKKRFQRKKILVRLSHFLIASGSSCKIYLFTLKKIEVTNRACQDKYKWSFRIIVAFQTKLQSAFFHFGFSIFRLKHVT